MLARVEGYLLSESSTPDHLIPQPIQEVPFLPKLLEQRPQRATQFMIHELKTALVYNAIHSVFLIFIFPFLAKTLFQESLMSFLWIFVTSLINFISKIVKLGFGPKLLFLYHITRTNEQRVLTVYRSKLSYFNSVSAKTIFSCYVIGLFSFMFTLFFFGILTGLCYKIQTIYLSGFLFRLYLSMSLFQKIYILEFKGQGGMTLKDINQMKMTQIDESMELEFHKKDAVCTICLEEFKIEQYIRKMRCKGQHILHQKCVDQWLLNNARCPSCNQAVYI